MRTSSDRGGNGPLTATRRPPPATERGRRTRNAIIDTAAGLMQAQGITATSLDDVLSASGTGKSQLYHYFTDKQDLVVAVIRRQLDRVMAHQPDLAEGGGDDPAAWARAIVDGHRSPGGPFSCPLGVLAGQVDDDPVLREAEAAAFEVWRAGIAGLLRRAQRAGRMDADRDADDAALAVLTALQGGTQLARLWRDADVVEVALDAALSSVGAGPLRQ